MWFGVYFYAGLPTEYNAMYNPRSLLYYSPLCMPVWRQIGTKYVCMTLVHIFPKQCLSHEANMP